MDEAGLHPVRDEVAAARAAVWGDCSTVVLVGS
jgi:hypothetical protein